MKIFTADVIKGFSDAFKAMADKLEKDVNETMKKYKSDFVDEHETQFKQRVSDEIDKKSKTSFR